jgi:hypothetical protein
MHLPTPDEAERHAVMEQGDRDLETSHAVPRNGANHVDQVSNFVCRTQPGIAGVPEGGLYKTSNCQFRIVSFWNPPQSLRHPGRNDEGEAPERLVPSTRLNVTKREARKGRPFR